MDRTVADPMIGRVLDGRYRVGPRIARGGMATVYEATDLRLDRLCALKVMHSGLGDDDDFAARFVREARSAARLSHPNVVGVFDQGDDDGTLFLAMEYIPGHTLRDLIRKEAPMSPAKALAVIDPVLSALAAAHAAGMIHRDVKPENVLLADDGRVKVADFGLARAISAETQHTATGGVLIGTVSYLSPELVVDGKADARSDVYAAGVVLYEMLTGRKPHEGESPIQVAYKHVHEDVPAPVEDRARPPGVRRRARRPRHRPRPGAAPRRRAGAAAPGAPGPRGPRRGPGRRPRADRRPDPDPAGAARGRGRLHRLRPRGRADHPDPGAGGARRAHRRHEHLRRRGPSPRLRRAHGSRRHGPSRVPGARVGDRCCSCWCCSSPSAQAWAAGGSAPGRYVNTPGVINLTAAAAKAKVEKAGLSFRVGGRAYSETVAPGFGGQHRPQRRPERAA